MWKEAVVAYFKALSRNSSGGTEKNKEVTQYGVCRGRGSSWTLPGVSQNRNRLGLWAVNSLYSELLFVCNMEAVFFILKFPRCFLVKQTQLVAIFYFVIFP